MPGYELIDSKEKKAVIKIFNEGGVLFAHAFENLRKNFYRRQDFNLKTFFINGAIYIVSKKHLLKSKKIYSNNHSFYKMPKNRSLDINDCEDIELAKKIL